MSVRAAQRMMIGDGLARGDALKAVTLSLILAMAASTLPQAASARAATLTVERDELCQIPSRPDHMRSTDVVTLDLPDESGPVHGTGSYQLTGTGYSLSGSSVYRGEVRDDAELILTFGQWSYAGKAMTPSAPEMPTAQHTVRLALEPGARRRIEFENAHADKAPCSGVVEYRLDLARETQRWRVSLVGSRLVEYLTEYRLVDPATGKSTWFEYAHGITFNYDLSAEVELTRRRGAWQFTTATVKKASITTDYGQRPDLYKVTAMLCGNCNKVTALAGTSLGGSLSGQLLKLKWPNLQPAVRVQSTFAATCAPGPHHATCEGDRKKGTNFADDDDNFFDGAAGHSLPLKVGPRRFTSSSENNPGAAVLYLEYDYTLSRLK